MFHYVVRFYLLLHKNNYIIFLQCTYSLLLILLIITMKEYKPQRLSELEYSFQTLCEESSFSLDSDSASIIWFIQTERIKNTYLHACTCIQ